jgi:LPXTG-motif cell wall-anchored protein
VVVSELPNTGNDPASQSNAWLGAAAAGGAAALIARSIRRKPSGDPPDA